ISLFEDYGWEEIVVDVDKDSKTDLDVWDGNNWYTESEFTHQHFYKINKIDEEEVEDIYLLVEYDQYQGTLDTAEILEKEELLDHIQELGSRNVEDYLIS